MKINTNISGWLVDVLMALIVAALFLAALAVDYWITQEVIR